MTPSRSYDCEERGVRAALISVTTQSKRKFLCDALNESLSQAMRLPSVHAVSRCITLSCSDAEDCRHVVVMFCSGALLPTLTVPGLVKLALCCFTDLLRVAPQVLETSAGGRGVASESQRSAQQSPFRKLLLTGCRFWVSRK